MVIPVHDVNPVRRTPVVTYLLIALNVLVFVIGPVAAAPLLGEPSQQQVCAQLDYFDRYAAEPDELLSGRTDRDLPAECEDDSPFRKVAFLSVLTAMFLHGGWAHLLGNMLYLLIFGNNVEDRLGRLKFLGFYLLCGYVATYGFASVFADSSTPLVGASGAIAGVLGAYLVMYPRARVWSLLTFFFFLPVRLPAWLVLGLWFVLQYLYTEGAGVSDQAGVAYLAHVLGFVAGALLVLRYRDGGVREGRPPPVGRAR
ncbi:MAG TPA: rhomboid family intramembrane serine protease [Mycobacteriales bacterium]|nr:rhomboid family intramembrane serine protease [Mycobacteriales bacterium]